METLEALPYQVTTARSFIGDTPYRIGPSAIGCRDNPHGKTSTPNPHNERICLVARWTRASAACSARRGPWATLRASARTGVEAMSLGAPTGPLGIVHRRGEAPVPYYDDLGTRTVYPAYHVVAGLTRAAGAWLVEATSTDDARVRCLAYRGEGAILLWLANLTGRDQTVSMRHGGASPFGILLDEESFERATTDPAAFEASVQPLSAEALLLRPYAVALACIRDA